MFDQFTEKINELAQKVKNSTRDLLNLEASPNASPRIGLNMDSKLTEGQETNTASPEKQ